MRERRGKLTFLSVLVAGILTVLLNLPPGSAAAEAVSTEKHPLRISRITVESKVYDGTGRIEQFDFALDERDLDDCDSAAELKEAIDLSLEFNSASAGRKGAAEDYNISPPVFRTAELAGRYDLILDEAVKSGIRTGAGDIVEIRHCDIITVIRNENQPVPYGEFDWNSYQSGLTAAAEIPAAVPENDATVIAAAAAGLKIKDPELGGLALPGEYPLRIEIEPGAEAGRDGYYRLAVRENPNYRLAIHRDHADAVVIVPRPADPTMVVLDPSSQQAINNERGIFVNRLRFSLKLRPADPLRYDRVCTVIDDRCYDLSGGGITQEEAAIPPGQESRKFSVWLMKGGVRVTAATELTVTGDEEGPDIEFRVGESTGNTAGPMREVKFTGFRNRHAEARIKVTDQQSGCEEWQYYIHKTDTDLSEPEIRAIAADPDSARWSAVSCEEVPYLLDIKVTDREAAGSYVVFIKARDRVGNTRIITSDGIVVDTGAPDQPEIGFRGAGTGYAFRGDVTVDISVTDPLQAVDDTGCIKSGIEAIEYQIIMDGSSYILDESGNKLAAEKPRTLWQSNRSGTGHSLAGLQRETAVKGQLILKADQFESNSLRLRVIVWDRAGNRSERTAALKIDQTAPTVEIEYRDQIEAPRNDIYFKKGRTAVIRVTDTNFSPELTRFRIKRRGEAAQICTLPELNALLGGAAAWQDSQPDSDRTYRSERCHIAEIAFTVDNSYEFEVVMCTDLAGNRFTGTVFKNSSQIFDRANRRFVIDTVRPVITVAYYAAGRRIKAPRDRRTYHKVPVTARITVEEANFSRSGRAPAGAVSLTTTGVNTMAGQERPAAGVYTKVLRSGSWENAGDSYTLDLQFDVDANYEFSLSYTDLAGNQATSGKYRFTVDGTAPSGGIRIGELGFWTRALKRITFGLFTNETQQVSISSHDKTSPIADISYYMSTEVLAKSELEKVAWKKGKTFTKRAEQAFIIYGRITDRAGNVTYLNSDGVILDRTGPEPMIKISPQDIPVNGIYNKDTAIDIQVDDPVSGDTWAGLQSVSYQVVSNGRITQSGTFRPAPAQSSERVRSLTERIVIDAEKNDSDRVILRVNAADKAGNTAAAQKHLQIDASAPRIQVTYNETGPADRNYYSTVRTATVTVKDRNFDPEGVVFSINAAAASQPSISPWSVGRTGSSEEPAHSCTVTFAKDDDYTFTLSATDLAGNKSEYGQTDHFVIDRTEPVVKVSYDDNKAAGSRYYNRPRRAVITVSEANFRAEETVVEITASRAGQDIEAPVVSSFRSSGKVHRATVLFAQDGDYRMKVSCRDRAGNRAVPYHSAVFTIDTVKPQVRLVGFKKANQDTVVPRIVCQDINDDPAGIEITLSGAKAGVITPELTYLSEAKTTLIENFRKDVTAGLDDIYTLTVRARDLAGNETRETAVFSLNRYGSAYQMPGRVMKLLENYYTNTPEDIVITEMNADTLKFRKIICSRDGQQRELEDGKDYRVTARGDDRTWKSYTYMIGRENFREDGKYTLTIYSEDQAANHSSNQSKDKKIEFVVDQTAPMAVITGIENGLRYRSDQQPIIINVKDNISLKSMQLEITEKGKTPVLKNFTSEELKDTYGVINESIAQSDQWQTVRVTAEDLAGNTYQSQEYRVFISTSLLAQYYMNKPLFIGSLILAVCLCIILFCKKVKG